MRKSLARHHNNYRGWSTSRKIVIFESDDWGSICMPSGDVQKLLLKKGYRIERCPYAMYDSLASAEDLERLFSTLSAYTDCNGQQPVFTANTVMANPDFRKIRESDFQNYEYELFTQTMERYPEHRSAMDLWRQGISSKLFYPQYHGREHINIRAWLKELNDIDSNYRAVFEHQVTWLGPRQNKLSRVCLRASLDTDYIEELEWQKKNIREGLELFSNLFGFRSLSFIANNYIYHPELNKTLIENGVKYIQGMKYQKMPLLGKPRHYRKRHYQGEVNDFGQVHLIRNCEFEPSQHDRKYDNVGECLKGIQNAFLWKKPAVISTHRLNYIGYLNQQNRDENLKLLGLLLKKITKKWPEVEFMNSVELGNLISMEKSNSDKFIRWLK